MVEPPANTALGDRVLPSLTAKTIGHQKKVCTTAVYADYLRVPLIARLRLVGNALPAMRSGTCLNAPLLDSM